MKPLLSQCLIGYKFGRVNVDKDYFLCCRIPPIGNFNEDGTYLINHSSSILLLRKGKYIDRISHHETEDNILKIIKKYL